MARVILVSNRLPITVRKAREGNREVVPSSGGLVAGLEPLHREEESLWFGCTGEKPDAELAAKLREQRLIAVPVLQAQYRAYYNGYSNSTLWPLFHYLIERCQFDLADFKAYQRVNERFAEAVLEEAHADDIIWVHDYHLMLLPAILRERLPNARIGFFLHTPFPSKEVIRVLPQREQILRGLLGADLIGVHTHDYADHLLRSVRRVLGLESRQGAVRVDGRLVRVEAHALGIDVDSQRRHAFSDTAEKRVQVLRRLFGDRQVILGVDRLDYTKGLPLKLEAFRQLLASSAHWREKAVLVQVAVPSRENIESYRQQKQEVERLVGEINGAYGRPGRMPIHYLYRSIPPHELGALYRVADVAFVSPVRDGLNLVAKEYAACHDEGDGVLVLSEFAGAVSELGEALRINPWNLQGTAQQLERALTMSAGERRQRMQAMHRRVVGNDVHRWVARFMRSLREPGGPAGGTPPMLSSRVLSKSMAPSFARARSALLMVDYDGSLREYTERYEEAAPSDDILELLRELASLRGVALYIVSGRDHDTIERWFGELPLALIAEHGLWIRPAGGGEWKPLGPPPDTRWKAKARELMEDYAGRTPGARIEEKTASLVWHYREAQQDLGEWQALELISVLEDALAGAPVVIQPGAQIVEVKQQNFDKGRAYDIVLAEQGPFDFVLAVGDDRTDEDLFAHLDERAFSVHVGPGPSIATSSVSSPASLRHLLRLLARARTGATAA